MTSLKPVLARLAQGETLTDDESEAAFGLIMSGEATPAQIAGLLMAMRVRGETVAGADRRGARDARAHAGRSRRRRARSTSAAPAGTAPAR